MAAIKEAGPYVVALAGMAAGFLSGRSTGRESRHHARVEALYQEMLEEMYHRHKAALLTMGVTALGEEPVLLPAAPPTVSPARVALYASRAVQDTWEEVCDMLLRMEMGGGFTGEEKTEALTSVGPLGQAVHRAMRKDLGVPPGAAIPRFRWWLSDTRRRRITQRLNDQLARQRAQRRAVGDEQS